MKVFLKIFAMKFFMTRMRAVVYRTRKGSAFEMRIITRMDKPIVFQESSKQGIALAGAFVNIFWPT